MLNGLLPVHSDFNYHSSLIREKSQFWILHYQLEMWIKHVTFIDEFPPDS